MRRITGIIALVLLGAAQGAPGEHGGLSPEEILSRHAEALGGREAIAKVRSVVTSGDLVIMPAGTKGEVRTWSVMPCLSRTEARIGIFQVRQGFDGERSWMIGPNGMLQIMRDEDSRRTQVTACMMESFAYLDPEGRFGIEPLGTALDDSVLCHGLAISPEGGYPCRVFFDARDWLVRKIETDSFMGTVVQTFGDYRVIAGVRFPFHSVTTETSIGQTLVVTVRELEVNAAVDPVLFLPPGEAAADFRFSGGGDAAEDIPFIYRARHLYLPVRIGSDGIERQFLLDSGAGMTMVDTSVRDRLSLGSGGTIPGVGAGGMSDIEITRLPGFSLRGIEFDTQTVAVFPVSRLTERVAGIETGGILGYDFLSRFTTRIDYERALISFYRPGTRRPPGYADSIPAPLLHQVFSLTAKIDGREGTFLVDTGANSSILQRRFAEDRGLLEGRRGVELAISGVGGDELATVARFDSFSVGEAHLAGPVFLIPRGDGGIGAFEGLAGIIGNDILERFTLWLDYAGQSVALEGRESLREPFWTDRSGMFLMAEPDGRITVSLVIPGTPAAEAGIETGDTLVSVGETQAGAGELELIQTVLSGTGTVPVIWRRGEGERIASLALRPYL